MSGAGKRTPMMEQYQQMKDACSDALLLFRLGDFYELFYEDAKVASELLELTLTGRGAGEQRMPMCGVPFHAADGYIARLVLAGFKVAICEQVEDPKAAKGLVRREIIRIVTPGTGYEYVKDGDRRLLIGSAARDGERYAAAVLDPMTGESWVRSGGRADCLAWLASMRPVELVASLVQDTGLVQALEETASRLKVTFSPFAGAGTALPDSAHDILVRYLEYTGKRSLPHLRAPHRVEPDALLALTASARAHLELTAPLHPDRKDATLLDTLNFTLTVMGRRRLREMIERPFATPGPIAARLDAVGALYVDTAWRADVRQLLRGLPDVARLASRLSYQTAVPRDLVALAGALERAFGMREALSRAVAGSLLAALCLRLADMRDLVADIARTLVDDPAGSGRDGGVVRADVDPELDRLRGIARGGREYIAALEQEERARTGIKSLKISFNRVFGYYIEVTAANAHLVPSVYERRQTLAGAERFVTPALREREQEILHADELAKEREWVHVARLLEAATARLTAIQETADALAGIDALASLAEAARAHGYVRPTVDEGAAIQIRAGRHPVVERHVGGGYVANDTDLSPDRQIAVITGPNMAGKSTYMRQVALIVLMAQMGSFVPADSAHIGIVDKLFTRIGASDDLAAGMSTFMVEMTESAEILREATGRSLLVFDEVGRGTATYDGMSIAEAMIEYAHDVTAARTLFATHYHELTALPLRLLRLFNLSVAVAEHEGQIIFLHRIVERSADRSYGIQVAERAGLPERVTKRAKQILAQLENRDVSGVTYRQLTVLLDDAAAGAREAAATVIDTRATALADGMSPGSSPRTIRTEAASVKRRLALADELAALELDGMTPRQAQGALYDWQERYRLTRVGEES